MDSGRPSRRAISVVILLLAAFNAFSISPAHANTLTFIPSADAYVTAASPTKNFGSDKSLDIDASPVIASYMRFSVSGLATVPTKVTLKVRNNKSLVAGYQLKAVSDTKWSETTISYSNAPATGTTIASSGPTTSGTWTSFDLTGIVAGNGLYSFALVGTSSSATGVSSKESSNPPQLAVTMTTSNTATSIIPTSFAKTLGAYDPGLSLTTLPNLGFDHYFVSWDMSTEWIRGVNQHQALLQDLSSSTARNRLPMVTLEPWSVSGLSASNLLQDIVAGKYDANIQWACSDLKTYGKTVIVRWGHEMENVTGRYPWATSNYAAYISAYHYFIDKCRALAPNTSYMWSPAGNRNLASYWPGATYADYVGLSVYDYPAWEIGYYGYNRSFDQNFTERYGYIKGYAKPVIIAEFGATGDTQKQWVSDALVDMANFPLLKMVAFFDAKDPAGWGSYPAPDWRIDPAFLSPPI